MKTTIYIILSSVMLTSCASMISGVSLSSLLSGKTLRVCPTERESIVEEASERALVLLREKLQEEIHED